MSTQPVTPDPSSLPATTQPVPSMQAQPAAPAAPASTLGAIASTPTPAPQPTSRLKNVLSAVANVVETGLAGIPDRGRPSFVTGLGEGARSEKQAEATQQAIKFKTFDDQVRMAELHNQDLKMQNDNQAQQDAHTEAELHMRGMANDLGIDYDTIANHGGAVMDHLTAQTAANGAASVPPGTHISADGSNIYMPKNPDAQTTRDGQKQLYSKLAPALGLPSLPVNAQFVPNKYLNMMTNKINGFDIAGNPPKHQDLPALISNAQVQRDRLAKNSGSPDQLKTIDNMIGVYQANLDALDKNDADVAAKKKQADLDIENSPANTAAAGKKAASIEQAKLNVTNNPANQDAAAQGAAKKSAAETQAKNAVSGQMFVGTDKTGNQIAGTADDLSAAGATGVSKLDADTGKKVITARQLVSPDGLFALIKNDMLNLDAKGKLGSSMESRFNDAMLQKAGADPDYAPLFVHTHLLSTALMQAHVGSRGSSDMMEEFQKLANSGKMNAPTLRSALGAEYNYVKEKAMLPKKQATTTAGGQ